MGYGFVEYQYPEEAVKAIQGLTGYQILNKRLKVSYSRQSSPELKNSNVYIAGYGSDLTKKQLELIFSVYGTVININMLKDANGVSRGAAFVRMHTNAEAVNAVSHLNGALINHNVTSAKVCLLLLSDTSARLL